jgi:hypothetical protein
MNERIHDLAHIALNGQTFYYTAMPIGFVGKFAELIVRECAEIADTAEPFLASDLIKQHFGVEE